MESSSLICPYRVWLAFVAPDWYHLFTIILSNALFVLVPTGEQPHRQVGGFSPDLNFFHNIFFVFQWFRVWNLLEYFFSFRLILIFRLLFFLSSSTDCILLLAAFLIVASNRPVVSQNSFWHLNVLCRLSLTYPRTERKNQPQIQGACQVV